MLNFFRKSIEPNGPEHIVAADWKAAAQAIELALQGAVVGDGCWFPRKGTVDNRKKFNREQFDWKEIDQSVTTISIEILVRDVDGNAGISWKFLSTVLEDMRITKEETESIIYGVIDRFPKPLSRKTT